MTNTLSKSDVLRTHVKDYNTAEYYCFHRCVDDSRTQREKSTFRGITAFTQDIIMSPAKPIGCMYCVLYTVNLELFAQVFLCFIAVSGNNKIRSLNDQLFSSDTEKSVLQSINEKISLLESQKSALQYELDQLNSELEVLQNRRASMESRIAPIWMLPNEVISYIFELGASDQEEQNDSSPRADEGSDAPDQPDFQILMSHVSRHFRDVAIKTPTLWSTIHVLDLAEPRLDYVKTCLERSGSLPFSICLDCEDEDSEHHLRGSNPAIDQVMTFVKDNLYRLERFMARFRFFESLHHVMRYLDKPAPQLRALELYDVDYEQTFDEDTTFSPQSLRAPLVLFGGEVPKLTKLMLDGVHVAWSQCNFKNLTVLNLGYHNKDVRPTYQEFQAIIKDSPSLRELSLQGSAPLLSEEVTDSNLYTPFILDSLEKLRVSDISSDYSSTLISLLHAPNLKSLVLSELDTNDFSGLFDRIAGPPALFPNMTSLKLVSIEASDAAAARLLRAYPRLEWLGLYAFHGCPQWVSLLEQPEGQSSSTDPPEHLCPALKCLRCVEVDLDDIKDMLNRRKDANVPLPRLELHRDENSFHRTSTLQWLEQNVDVKFIDPSDYDSDDEDSADESDWVSEDSNELHYSDFSDGLDYYDEEEEEEEDYDDDDDVDDDEDEYGPD